MHKILIVIVCLLFSGVGVYAQGSDSGPAKNQGVVFKIPDGVFPVEWRKSGFNGILMLRQDSPSGLFVVYPDDNETMEQLRIRVSKYVVPMFVHDKASAAKLEPARSSIPNHTGDSGDTGLYYLYATEKSQLQILFYERVANGKNFLYGYFANKQSDTKDKAEIRAWADEKGQGVKVFEAFRKTIKE